MASTSNAIPSREDIENAFSQISQVVHLALRPLPTQTGDYSYLPEDKAQSSVFQQLKHLNIKNLQTLTDVIIRGIDGKPVDDRTYVMERVIQLASELPLTSPSGMGLTGTFLTQLWNDLKHPPLSYLGKDFIYRQADGSCNNIMWPQIGVAGAPYARTVKPEMVRPTTLPDPGVVFDSIMVRKDFREHPNKISSVLFYLASIIIHDLFRTSHEDFTKSETSSYLDLSPLYDSNEKEQDLMRTFKNGKIKPDCFSEKRILGFPPGVGVLLIMFNRFHNYVVEQLALIDENGRFSSIRSPRGRSPGGKTEAEYDNALFQTGRLITGGLYVQCILKDYVRTILNLNRTNSPWDLDPRSASGKALFGQGAAEAGGNQVSAEFNLVYRWHSCVSQRDEQWTKDAFAEIFSGSQPRDLDEFIIKISQWAQELDDDPQNRPFAKLSRTKSGSFEDDDLAAIFAASVEDPAGAYGANHVPEIFRDVEILGIIQARSWNLASLNEFRKYFNLAPHKTFEDINPDPYVAEQLKRLYDHPDFVELYPGMAIEEAKVPMAPGSGLCTTFTISRAVLSDAVALVRGDRFYTVDYHPKNLTNWGFSEVNYDLSVDNGCVFYKLVLRAFPRNFGQNSVYAHYPLVCPDENEKILTSLNTAENYDFGKPRRVPEMTVIYSYKACKSILENKRDYKITWGKDSINFLLRHNDLDYGAKYMISGDAPVNAQSRNLMKPALYTRNWKEEVKNFYEDITLELLHRNAYQLAGTSQIDIVRDVSNLAQAHFAASIFSLPLKTTTNPHGIYSELELYTALTIIFTSIFCDADPSKSFPLRQAARMLTQQLGKLLEVNVQYVSKAGVIADFLDRFYKHDALTDYGIHMIQRLLKSGLSVKDVVWTNILPTAGAMAANQSQLFSQCLDYYLSEEGKDHLPEIHRLSNLDTQDADEQLLHYFLEGARLRSAVGLYRDIAKSREINDDGKIVHLEAGHRLLCHLMAASRDPKVFPNPDRVLLDRDINLYAHYGIGPHECLGKDMTMIGMTAMLKTVGRLKNLRRVPGSQGELKKIPGPLRYPIYMTEDQRSYFPFPTSMKINWDGDLPSQKRK